MSRQRTKNSRSKERIMKSSEALLKTGTYLRLCNEGTFLLRRTQTVGERWFPISGPQNGWHGFVWESVWESQPSGKLWVCRPKGVCQTRCHLNQIAATRPSQTYAFPSTISKALDPDMNTPRVFQLHLMENQILPQTQTSSEPCC